MVSTTSSEGTQADPNSGVRLAMRLKEKSHNYKKLLAAVLKCTGGQPFLTQKLFKLIVEAPDSPPQGRELEWVEELVRSRLLANWEENPELKPLQNIRDRLLDPKPRNIQLLKLYQEILQEGFIVANESSEQTELRLLGLVVKEHGFLKVHNLIYEYVFDLDWVEKAYGKIKGEKEQSESEFINTFAELERKLLVTQVDILSQDESEEQGSTQVLYEVLRDVTEKIGKLLGADRSTIFLLNEEKTELWSLVAQNEKGEFLDIQVRVGEGIAGTVAKTKKLIHIPDKVYEDPRSQLVKKNDEKYNYRTENILAFPILDDNTEAIAVIQLLNKLPEKKQQEHQKGFSRLDLERLAKCVEPIQRILESCQSSYKASKKLRATAALAEATRSLDQINLDTKAILQRVMNAAKKLMNADRSTLWLVDRDRGDLWTELPGKGEMRCQYGVGFVGRVAAERQAMIIPFDLYEHPDAENAKKTDAQTRYRTCSLLCMPILNPEGELLGVTQLVNKRKPGNLGEYRKEYWPRVPEYFKASFDKNDRQSMQVFNDRVGVILQFIKTHENLKHLAQIEPKEAVHQTLAILSEAVVNPSDEEIYNPLSYMLNFVSLSLGKLLGVDHTTIFLLHAEDKELWCLIPEDEEASRAKEIRIPANKGIARIFVLSKYKKAINLLSHLNDRLIQTGIRSPIQNLLLFPIFDLQGNLVAIIRFLNKLKSVSSAPLSKRIDPQGFTQGDADKLKQRANSILPILQACQSFHRQLRTITEQQQAIDPLYQAISLVHQSNSPEEMIEKVMHAVKKLTNADRSTLWLVDYHTNELWTKIPQLDGSWMETRVPIGEGFVGIVAATGQPLNIPFDLYQHPDSELAKRTDRKTGYRTCSLLCMPVLGSDGELLAVTQLVNKRKPGDMGKNKSAYRNGQVPDYFQTSFDEKDRKDMEIFNNQVGVVLPGLI